jgi:hypothetical protein
MIWQQTLTAGSTLNTTNSIDGGGNEFVMYNNFGLQFAVAGNGAYINLAQSSPNQNIEIRDSIIIRPYVGKLYIDTLNNETFQNTLMGWTSTSGTNRGKVGYITTGTGISISGGSISTTAYIPSGSQGDLLYFSASNTLSNLSKNVTATRYLSNTGTSNNPAWSQIDLSNGVTNDLPFSNLTQGSARSVLGVTGNSTADFASIQGTADQILRVNGAGTALAFGSIDLSKSASVGSSILPLANGGTGSSTGSGLPYWALSGTSTLTGNTTISTSTNTVEIGSASGGFNLNGVNTDWKIGDYNGDVFNTIEGFSSLEGMVITVGNGGLTIGGSGGLAGTGSRAVLADASGVLSAPVSDSTTKFGVRPIENATETLMQFNPVTFWYKKEFERYGKGQQVGFIAQEVGRILPNSTYINNSNGKMGYNEIDIVPILTKSLQEAIERINQLEIEIQKLKNK